MKTFDTSLDRYSIDKQTIVSRANAVRPGLTSDIASVWEVVDANDIVFAAWPDPRERDRVGTLIVKGQRRLQQIADGGEPQALSWTAIPCISAEQAEALRRVAGERNPLH